MRPRPHATALLPLVLVACADSSSDEATGSTGLDATTSPTAAPTSGALTTGDDPTGPGPAADDAAILTAELPTALACGESFAASVRVRNTGASTWTHDAFKLGAVDDDDPLRPGDPRVWLPDGVAVAPNSEHAFSFDLTAPDEPGVYTTDWRMVHEGVQWFGGVAAAVVTVTCDEPPSDIPHLEGRALVDGDGPFLALGATMMWAAWGYKYDRPRLEANLQYLADHDFDFIRALGVVGDAVNPDYWDGREIDPHWPDYADVIAGLTDLAHDTYGLRVEWTLIGDGQVTVPTWPEREQLRDTFLAVAAGREPKILCFEVANESWQNGFGGDQGLADLRALTQSLRDRSPNLVAASAPPVGDCPGVQSIYQGDVADLATVHFDRDIGQLEGPWRPVFQPWALQFCDGVPVASNNEPIGPGSSVAEETDPVRLVAGAVTTYLSGLPIHVFHTRAGIRGDDDLWNMPGVDAFVHMRALLPPDLPAWDRKDGPDPAGPFTFFAGEAGQLYPDTAWVQLQNPESGAIRAYAAVREPQFVAFPIGILGSVTVAPRRPMTFDVLDPTTGATLASHDLDAGAQVQLSGSEALLLRGTYK